MLFHEITQQRVLHFNIYTSSLFYHKYIVFFLYIYIYIYLFRLNTFCFCFYKDVKLNVCNSYLIQTSRPFGSANYNTQHTPQTTNMAVGDPYPKTLIRDRSLNRQASDYTRAQMTYIKDTHFHTFCEVYAPSVS